MHRSSVGYHGLGLSAVNRFQSDVKHCFSNEGFQQKMTRGSAQCGKFPSNVYAIKLDMLLFRETVNG